MKTPTWKIFTVLVGTKDKSVSQRLVVKSTNHHLAALLAKDIFEQTADNAFDAEVWELTVPDGHGYCQPNDSVKVKLS